MSSVKLQKNEWRIVDIPEGWELSFRYNLPLSKVAVRYWKRNWGAFVYYYTVSLLLVVFAFVIFLKSTEILNNAFATVANTFVSALILLVIIPLGLLLSFLFTLIFWPIRYPKIGAAFAFKKDRRLHYFGGNRTEAVRVCNGKAYFRMSIFPESSLRSLHLVSVECLDKLDQFGLQFDGDSAKTLTLLLRF